MSLGDSRKLKKLRGGLKRKDRCTH
ncbi:hypothetical protein ZOSMA_3G01700 [Zostera marina]|uniref:Uncharacterized protein n=1 Tax=Zostera marina TaxID=29655 RepID=A0A0K9P3S7_ZOSMR|nr:hypothetical protein ZOSMA_3G01700 [Zostera marina]